MGGPMAESSSCQLGLFSVNKALPASSDRNPHDLLVRTIICGPTVVEFMCSHT